MTISHVLKLYSEKKTIASPTDIGRPRITTVRAMKHYVTKDTFETAAAISRKIKANTDEDVSPFTLSRRLNEFGFTARSPETKPLISKKSRKARLEYAEARVVWSDGDWD